MKQVASAYTFNPGGRTVTLTGLTIGLDQLLAIFDQTTGLSLFIPNAPAFVPTIVGSVVTLNLLTPLGSAQASDDLLIIYDDQLSGAKDGTDASGVSQLSGGVGIRGWLSGIYAKLLGSIAVTGTFWQATQPISAPSLPLPTGAATSGNQATEIAALATIATNTNGAATAANQATEITSLGTIATAQGVQGTGLNQPTGGSGLLGFLSGIYAKLLGSIAVTGTFFQVTQPVSGAVTANAGTNLNTSLLALEAGGNLAALATKGQAAQAASLSVALANNPDIRVASASTTTADVATTSTAGFNSVAILTGTPTAGSTLLQAINGQACVSVTLSAATATANFEVSADNGVTFIPITMRQRGSGFTTSAATGVGIFDGDCSGKTHFRVRQTGAGGLTATLCFSGLTNHVAIMNPVRLFDNTSGAQNAIKAASTAAVATDAAIVVALSPNNGALPYQYTAKSPGQHNISLTNALGTSLTIPSGAKCSWVQPHGGTVTYTTDGVTIPSATVGMTITDPIFPPLFLTGSMLTNAKFFSASGATLDAEFAA